MDLHVHLGVAVWDFFPRNHLPQKITGEDNIAVVSLLRLYLHFSSFKQGNPPSHPPRSEIGFVLQELRSASPFFVCSLTS